MPRSISDPVLPVSWVWQTTDGKWRTLHLDKYGAVVSARQFNEQLEAKTHAGEERTLTIPLDSRIPVLDLQWEAAERFAFDYDGLTNAAIDFLSSPEYAQGRGFDRSIQFHRYLAENARDKITNILDLLELPEEYHKSDLPLRRFILVQKGRTFVTRTALDALVMHADTIDKAEADIRQIEKLRYGIQQNIGREKSEAAARQRQDH